MSKQIEPDYSASPPHEGELIEFPAQPRVAAIEAEQSVLGGLLLDNTAWDRIADLVSPGDFYRADHRLIFEHIGKLLRHGQPADALTVAEALESVGELEKTGGRAYLAALATNTPSAANISRYAEIVKERAQCREVMALGAELQEKAAVPGVEIEPLRLEIASRLSGIRLDGGSADWPAALDLEALAEREPEPPRFIVPDWLPCGYASLLAGHGGVGKSAIALHLAAAIALGARWAGLDCEARRVLYVSCEDRAGVLHWRLHRIAKHLGINLAELAGRLAILELAGRDSTLWERDPRSGASLMPAYARLAERVRGSRAELLIIDGVTDTFGGNENSRGEVKRYINSLLTLIPAEVGALLLLAHIDKALARGTGATSDGYSGSTAWHNAARARWYLFPETAEGEDGGQRERTGRLRLELQKSNLGPINQALAWSWDVDGHLFLPEPAPMHFDREHEAREARCGILLALAACEAASIVVPAAMQGPRTAFHVLAARPELTESLRSGTPGLRRFWREMEQLRQLRYVEEREYRRKNGHRGEQLSLTSEGKRHIATF